MKRLIYSKTSKEFELHLTKITSLILVDNAFEFNPRNHANSISIDSAKKLRKDYSKMTREQLLELPKKELASIRDITVLRKLKLEDLDLAQKLLVAQANEKYSDVSTRIKVQEVLDRLKECKSFFIWRTAKNLSFVNEIENLGGQVENSDLRKIVHSLKVEDFTEYTLSYLDDNWNSLLMVAEYNGDYTFKAIDEDGEDVTVKGLDLYIKLDINELNGESIGAMSFHRPEFKMNHPYSKK